MDLRVLTDKHQKAYNQLVTHIMQSWEWGQFRQAMGLELLRYGIFESGKMIQAFQLTLHKIPFTNSYVGYLPKGPLPDQTHVDALTEIAKKHNCAFIKIEPNIIISEQNLSKIDSRLQVSPKSLFSKHNFLLDLTPSEEELLTKMHQKTRYNIRLAEKKGVTVKNLTTPQALTDYLKLYFETTKRQGFHGHNPTYHQTVWKTLRANNMVRLLIAYYQKQPLTAWMLFNFKGTLYYAYGGSSDQHRDVMSSNLVAWETIKEGKAMGLKTFDMWGALGPDPDPRDPWIGFHRFKSGYGGQLVEYLGTFDYIQNPLLYTLFTSIDKATKLKVLLLKVFGK